MLVLIICNCVWYFTTAWFNSRAEMRWDEMRWDEMRWDEMRWDEMRWDALQLMLMWVQYIPVVAYSIILHNQLQTGTFLNLRGIAIGNGLTNAGIQFASYAPYAYEEGLISKAFAQGMRLVCLLCCYWTTLLTTFGLQIFQFFSVCYEDSLFCSRLLVMSQSCTSIILNYFSGLCMYTKFWQLLFIQVTSAASLNWAFFTQEDCSTLAALKHECQNVIGSAIFLHSILLFPLLALIVVYYADMLWAWIPTNTIPWPVTFFPWSITGSINIVSKCITARYLNQVFG